MSLLADLLSKKNSAEPSGGRDIPPTLIRAHGIPANVSNFKKRYIVISAVSVVIIVVGVLAMFQLGPFSTPSTKKPILATQQITPPVPAPPVPVPAATVPDPTPPAPPHPAPVALASSPSPDKTATEHEAKTPRAAVNSRRPTAKSAKAGTRNRLGAIIPANRAAKKKQGIPAEPEPETASSSTIDTAKRDTLLYAARSAEQSGNWNSALASYRWALKIDPDNYKIMSNAAAALNNLGMYDEGVKTAKLALGKKPDYVPAMINAAIAYSSTGNSQEALQLFAKASSADPSNRNLAINLGILQERSGKLEDAQKTYRRLADDGDPLALHGMGRVYERTGNKIEAARVYRQIMALSNASPALKKEVKGKLARLDE